MVTQLIYGKDGATQILPSPAQCSFLYIQFLELRQNHSLGYNRSASNKINMAYISGGSILLNDKYLYVKTNINIFCDRSKKMFKIKRRFHKDFVLEVTYYSLPSQTLWNMVSLR